MNPFVERHQDKISGVLSCFDRRAVKILMRLPDDNISAAHLSVPYNGLIRQHDSLFAWQLEITVHCLCPDDFARHDNAPDTR